MAEQTAVEWLQEQLNPDIKTMQGNIIQELLEQAKQMEKEQHEETFQQSRRALDECMPPVWESWEQYYKETYGKK